MKPIAIAARLCAALCLVACTAGAVDEAKPESEAANRHAGYYYPEPTSRETYNSRAQVVEQLATRANRLALVVGITHEQLDLTFTPRYVVFAKGDEADKLIIVALDDELFRTAYRMRAVLAQMTAMARASELFQSLQVEDLFTFLDLVRMLGFAQVTVSDGDRLTHQITLE
jgi:hypothetical protein